MVLPDISMFPIHVRVPFTSLPPQTGPPSFGNPFVKCLEVPVQVCIHEGKHRARKGEQFVCGVRRRRCWSVVSQWIRGVYSVYIGSESVLLIPL